MKRSSRRISRIISILLGVSMMFSLFGCGKTGQVMDGDGMVYEPSYAQISQDEAKLMMKDDDGHVIVDVRRADEYAQGHIPGAILIPNERAAEIAVRTVRKYLDETGSGMKVLLNVFKDQDLEIYRRLVDI